MKLIKLAIMAALLVGLAACTGMRGYHGGQKVCENHNFLGISINEIVAPCK